MSEQTNPFQINPFYKTILQACEETAWIYLVFNRVPMLLPAATIMTMAHCLPQPNDGPLHLYVETAHLDWMRSKLTPGCAFLDVGSATGAMTLPIAMSDETVEVIAFEPAARARSLLEQTLVKNKVYGVKIVPIAISNRDGTETFYELRPSEDGAIPFLPEASTLSASAAPHHPHDSMAVQTMTLDTVARRYGLKGRELVVKIDIEGFEELALETATELFTKNTVHVAIDIHSSPFGTGTTLERCTELLVTYGFGDISSMGHVLIASRLFLKPDHTREAIRIYPQWAMS